MLVLTGPAAGVMCCCSILHHSNVCSSALLKPHLTQPIHSGSLS